MGVSRIVDYYHNYSDVTCGALIGTGISSLIFYIFNNELYHYEESDSQAQGTESMIS